MSLDTINKEPPKQKKGKGYQVFALVQDQKEDRSEYNLVFPNTNQVRKTGLRNWTTYSAQLRNTLTCKDLQIWDKKKIHVTYKAGFHIWVNEKDAEEHLGWMQIMLAGTSTPLVVRKVNYTDAFAEGYIDARPLIIAKHMCIQGIEIAFLGEEFDEDDGDFNEDDEDF